MEGVLKTMLLAKLRVIVLVIFSALAIVVGVLSGIG